MKNIKQIKKNKTKEKKMRILSIIPVRGGSKAIPMKNLVLLNKKPLLYYTVTASLKSSFINRTVISTDHEDIGKYARKIGAEVIMRPSKLAGDKTQTEPVMLHVIEYLKKKKNYIPDFIVLLQNTSPFRNAKHIDEAFKLFFKKKYDSLLSGFSSDELIWMKKNHQFYPLNYNLDNRPQRQKINPFYLENGAIYITKLKNFKKTHCRISGKMGFYTMPKELSIEIDNKSDLKMARKIFKNKRSLID